MATEPGGDDLGIAGLTDPVVIGRGGFAVVYRAYQVAFDRFVAVKVLENLAPDNSTRNAFERECRAIGRLQPHPNIVTVHYVGSTSRGAPVLVMAYLGRGSLKRRLDTEVSVPWREAVEIGVKIARALDVAHQHNVIHRDVKPDNILIGDNGEPQLTDFGIARLTDSVAVAKSRAAFTPAHVAPEILGGGPPSPAVDVYSLASTIFELIVGRPAFVEHPLDPPFAVMNRVVTDPVPDLLRGLGVPEPVCEVVESAMAKVPGERPGSAEVFATALQTAGRAVAHQVRPSQPAIAALGPLDGFPADQAPPVASPGPAVARRPPPPRRKVKIVALVVAVTLTAAGITILTRYFGPVRRSTDRQALTTTPQTSTTLTQTTTQQQTPTTQAIASTIAARMPAPGRDPTGLTYDGNSFWVPDNSTTVFSVSPSGAAEGNVSAPNPTPEGITWDGNGFWLFTSNHGDIDHFRVNGSMIVRLGSCHPPTQIFGGDISHDMSWDDGTIWWAEQYKVYRLSTSGAVIAQFASSHNITGVEWSGRDLWLAYDNFPNGAVIERVDTAGNVQFSFSAPIYGISALAWAENTLWALGEDDLGGIAQIYRLNIPSQ